MYRDYASLPGEKRPSGKLLGRIDKCEPWMTEATRCGADTKYTLLRSLRWTLLLGSSVHLVKIGECRWGIAKSRGICCASGFGSDTVYDYWLPAQSVLAFGFDSFHQMCGRASFPGPPQDYTRWSKSQWRPLNTTVALLNPAVTAVAGSGIAVPVPDGAVSTETITEQAQWDDSPSIPSG